MIGTVAARDVLDAIEQAGGREPIEPAPSADPAPVGGSVPASAGGGRVNWAWLERNTDQILSWLVDHFWLAALPTVLGLLLALPLGALAHRYRWSYATLITLAGLLYTIPSIALFVVLPGILGTRILDPLNVVVALTLYTLALLVRVVADALDSVPPLVVQSAIGDGLPAAPVADHRAAAAGHPGDRGGSAGGRGVQRQPGLGGRAARHPAARPTVHRRVPAGLLHPDHRRHRAVPAAGRRSST